MWTKAHVTLLIKRIILKLKFIAKAKIWSNSGEKIWQNRSKKSTNCQKQCHCDDDQKHLNKNNFNS